jgi:hypothetical protein
MTPKEKAEELFGKFYSITGPFTEAKQCALIAVDNIFEFMKMDDEYNEDVHFANSKWVNYFQQVKQEIEKL